MLQQIQQDQQDTKKSIQTWQKEMETKLFQMIDNIPSLISQEMQQYKQLQEQNIQNTCKELKNTYNEQLQILARQIQTDQKTQFKEIQSALQQIMPESTQATPEQHRSNLSSTMRINKEQLVTNEPTAVYNCPYCDFEFKTLISNQGRRAQCAKCNAKFTIPSLF